MKATVQGPVMKRKSQNGIRRDYSELKDATGECSVSFYKCKTDPELGNLIGLRDGLNHFFSFVQGCEKMSAQKHFQL